MIRKLKKLWNKYIVYRGVQLTPKGECFKQYCEQIQDNTLISTIESYEDILNEIRDILIEDYDIVLDRKEIAQFILYTYEEIL